MNLTNNQKEIVIGMLKERTTIHDKIIHNRHEITRLNKLSGTENNLRNYGMLVDGVELAKRLLEFHQERLSHLTAGKIAELVGANIIDITRFDRRV